MTSLISEEKKRTKEGRRENIVRHFKTDRRQTGDRKRERKRSPLSSVMKKI